MLALQEGQNFWPAPRGDPQGPEALAQPLIAAAHPHLLEARIVFLFRRRAQVGGEGQQFADSFSEHSDERQVSRTECAPVPGGSPPPGHQLLVVEAAAPGVPRVDDPLEPLPEPVEDWWWLAQVPDEEDFPNVRTSTCC
jgi:hypothetical protein